MRRRGFTLLEMAVVVAIMVIIVGLLLPELARSVSRTYESAAAGKTDALASGADRFVQDTGAVPSGIPALQSNTNVDGRAGWAGPYVVANVAGKADDVGLDPWGRNLVASTLNTAAWLPAAPSAFRVRSDGGDLTAGTADDITSTVDLTRRLRDYGDWSTARDLAAFRNAISLYNRAYFDGYVTSLLKASSTTETLTRGSGSGYNLDGAGGAWASFWPKVRDRSGVLIDAPVTDGYGQPYLLDGQGLSVRVRSSVATGL